MKGKIRLVLLMVVLVMVVPACQAAGVTETQIAGGVILQDDFSRKQWGTGTDADNSVEYVNETLQMIVYKRNHFVWSRPNTEVYEDVHMEVTVINNGTDPTTAFGLICNKSEGEGFYYFAITPVGQYAIALATEGEADRFLTNDDAWADSGLIPVNADSYRIGADCGNSILTLYVDEQVITSVLDPTYSSGQVAVFAWSDVEAVTTNVSFDDFVMTKLP